MRALITGGAGFIGSHLADYLLSLGWEVLIIDDCSANQSYINIDQAIAKGAQFWQRSIAQSFSRPTVGEAVLVDAIRTSDVVFHLAAIVGVKLVDWLPVVTITRNTEATAAVLEYATIFKKPTIIASSSEVYGHSMRPVLSESQELRIPAPTRTRWGYAAGKIMDEYTALAYHRAHGLPVVIARLFNTIGPRQVPDHGMVVPRFINQALDGRPITVYGNGYQRRSFAWVGDVVRALVGLVGCREAYGEAVNIGHPHSHNILYLAHLVRDVTGSSSEIQHVPYEIALGAEDDIQCRVPDLKKIQGLIDYKTTMNLPEMIQAIVAERTKHADVHAAR